RNGVDAMTTETTCLTSVWRTDEIVKTYFKVHGRPEEYRQLDPGADACYDGAIVIDLDTIEPMIAFPFHPSNAYSIREFYENSADILAKVEQNAQKQIANPKLHLDLRSKLHNGRFRVDQADIAGCSGGSFENLVHTARIMEGHAIPNEFFTMSIYPESNPVLMELLRTGEMQKIISAGAILKSAFCGPCFGAGDVPSNGSIAIRHTTRNFPNREGSKPKENQLSSVALMDARSIAATAINGGYLTAATEIDYDDSTPKFYFDGAVYQKTIYNGFGHPKPKADLRFGPNITDWPNMVALQEHVLLKVASVIPDAVTTTDELIPSGDTSSYRSNPVRMADFTLSRRDPEYVGCAKQFQALENARQNGEENPELVRMMDAVAEKMEVGENGKHLLAKTGLGTVVCSLRPGDGSAREQAASCQRVLGGLANICVEYATKRYRSNLVNWGMIPFTWDSSLTQKLSRNDLIWIPNAKKAVQDRKPKVEAYILKENEAPEKIVLRLENLSQEEAEIILAGCLINYYARKS
ncbi:MAG: hydratase, partial [Lawsonibacter sp.]|nr:hydratase [Lawsonibacter sp.]